MILNKIKISLLCAISIICFASFTNPDMWVEHFSKDHHFHLKFPKKPIFEVKTVYTDLGKLRMILYISEGFEHDDNYIYMVSSTTYPATEIHSDKTEMLPDFYRGIINDKLKKVDGKLLSESEMMFGKYKGMEFKVGSAQESIYITSRIVLVNNELHMLKIFSVSDKQDAAMKYFFDSFILVENPANSK